MKKKYRLIHFEETPWNESDGTTSYICRNNKKSSDLGIVEYYKYWKMYVFEPYGNIVLSSDCMKDIIHFMSQLTKVTGCAV